MNITLAVALTTAASTLAAGLIASVVSLKIQRQQIGAQRQLAADERREHRVVERREIRRQTYVQLLTRFDEIERLLQNCWEVHMVQSWQTFEISQGHVELVRESIRSAVAGVIAFDHEVSIVAMEGPEDVTNLANALRSLAGKETNAITELATKSPSKARVEAREPYGDAMQARRKAKRTLIAAMQTALNESPSPEMR